MRTRVKICGITRPEDIDTAVRLGADALGFVFYPRSPRAVEVGQAAALLGRVPPFVTAVGLFVDPDPEWVAAVLDRVPLDLLQFHGEEPPEACRRYGRRYIKAVRMREEVDLRAAAKHYGDADGLLLDAYRPGVPGGTGETFDWDRIPADLAAPLILAGGLGPENVFEAVRRVRPYAVDVSSGVEAAAGIKDAGKVAAFMRGVERADSE